MSTAIHHRLLPLAGALALFAPGCHGDTTQDSASSGFTDSQGSNSDPDDGPGEYLTTGGDTAEPPGPGDGAELCDAGDEAWAKRLIPLVHGRRPESIREVRVLVQMVEQLEALGVDGRATVAMGLARGDQYRDRWKQWIYEQLRVNVSSDRRNEDCYDVRGPEADSPELAAFIRDNPVASNYGQPFRMADVVYSSLLLDDLSPAYRADNFARHSAPVIAGNICPEELEDLNRAAFGKIFESSYLGRFTECMDCHRTEMSVTDNSDPEADRHWPLPGNVELATYGVNAALPDAARSHSIFRRHGFSATPWLTPGIIPGGCDIGLEDAASGDDLAWGMDEQCGLFLFSADAETDILSQPPDMVGTYEDVAPPDGVGATIVTLDERMRVGLDEYASGGFTYGADGTLDDYRTGFARLYSMNIANRVWREAMGYPLVVANNFPRNEAQQQTLLTLTDAFGGNRYSLRNLLVAVATHDYFNQSPPDECDASIPYHMAAIFEPFTKSSTDPVARGNGVGDTLHRYSAMVLLDSLAQSMWWNKPQRFGPSGNPNQLPGSPDEGGCGTGAYPACTEAPSNIDFLRDIGVFLNDSESGFNGVDFNGLLQWESQTAQGGRIDFGGDCTGPLGAACPAQDWVSQLVAAAIASGATVRDVASAVKDRLITEPTIYNSGEEAAIELVMGASLSSGASEVPAEQLEAATRRYAGLLLNTPQFLLAGVPSKDQDPSHDPIVVVPGTSTQELCNYLGNLVLGTDFSWSCGAEGITISG